MRKTPFRPKVPESKDLASFAVAVCCVPSLLIQMTLVPRLMVMLAGLKLKFWIETVLVGCFWPRAVGCSDTTNVVVLTSASSPAAVINQMVMRLIATRNLLLLALSLGQGFCPVSAARMSPWSSLGTPRTW